MKQNYVKPTIMIERFSLCQNIASDCTAGTEWGSAAHADKYSCGWYNPSGEILWLIDSNVCNDHYGPNDDVGGLCYNNPNGGLTIFGS